MTHEEKLNSHPPDLEEHAGPIDELQRKIQSLVSQISEQQPTGQSEARIEDMEFEHDTSPVEIRITGTDGGYAVLRWSESVREDLETLHGIDIEEELVKAFKWELSKPSLHNQHIIARMLQLAAKAEEHLELYEIGYYEDHDNL